MGLGLEEQWTEEFGEEDDAGGENTRGALFKECCGQTICKWYMGGRRAIRGVGLEERKTVWTKM